MVLTLTIQGWFYVVTGLWPILHMKSFEMVSGPKRDKWLVKAIGLMIACSGYIFINYNQNEIAEDLAVMNAICLACIDIYYSLRGVIWKTYLGDAVIEFGFICAYLIT